MNKLSDSLPKEQVHLIGEKVGEILNSTGLTKKGVDVVRLSGNGSEVETKQIGNIVGKFLDSTKKWFFKPNEVKLKNLEQGMLEALGNIAAGKNAAYIDSAKKIVMPKDKLSLAVFHEMGHALNANMSKIGRALQKMRGATVILPVLGLAMMSTSKSGFKNADDKNDRPFANKHAGKLAFLTFVPTLIEEGLASIKGGGIAKKVLSPDLAKKVSKTNAFGFATYLIGALATSLTFSFLANANAKGDRLTQPSRRF